MKQRVQCKACPWKVSTVPARDIPGGYCEKKHAGLADTIAKPADLSSIYGPLRMMACHESPGEEGRNRAAFVCVGWLDNQLGPGNNIALRLAASRDHQLMNYKLVGEQHATFEDTLPKADHGTDDADGDEGDRSETASGARRTLRHVRRRKVLPQQDD